MPWTSPIPILIWFILFVPFTIYMVKTDIQNRVKYILLILAYISVNLYFLLVVNFAFVDYWLRGLPVIALVVFLARILLLPRHRRWLPDRTKKRPYAPLIFSAAVILIMAYPNYAALVSYRFKDTIYRPVLILYPAQTGMYVFTNGGNGLKGVGMNDLWLDWLGRPNHSSAYMAYGSDIMKISIRGMMASTFFPQKNDDFYGFADHDPIYTPCPGVVVKVEDGHPDVKPFSQPTSEIGNFIVIQCYEYFVTVGNLRNGSIGVKEGEVLAFNRQLGYIGNSGTPTIPHLHIHTTIGNWNELGTPVPTQFEYNYGMRNLIYLGQR